MYLGSYSRVVPSDELVHYGVLGMKWGIRRSPKQLEAARRQRGEKKQSRVTKKQEKLRANNESQKEMIKTARQTRNAINAAKLQSTVRKSQLDRRIATNDFWTERGRRKAQDESFDLNAKIKRLEEADLKQNSAIANAIRRMDINNKKILKLDEKYIRIGKKYLGQ